MGGTGAERGTWLGIDEGEGWWAEHGVREGGGYFYLFLFHKNYLLLYVIIE